MHTKRNIFPPSPYRFTSALDKAWNIGREGNLLVALQVSFRLVLVKKKIPLESKWDEPILRKTLDEALRGFNLEPKDATFEITENNQMLIHHPVKYTTSFDDSLIIEQKIYDSQQKPSIKNRD